MGQSMAEITATENGPYKLEGASVKDAEGNELKPEGTHFLCRCGHSNNKPFCDGTHSKVDFQG